MAATDIKLLQSSERDEIQRLLGRLQNIMFVFSEIHLALEYVARTEQDRRVYMDLTMSSNIERMELALTELENHCA